MAGRPKRIRSIQSYVNHIDNNTFSGPSTRLPLGTNVYSPLGGSN